MFTCVCSLFLLPVRCDTIKDVQVKAVLSKNVFCPLSYNEPRAAERTGLVYPKLGSNYSSDEYLHCIQSTLGYILTNFGSRIIALLGSSLCTHPQGLLIICLLEEFI